MELPTKNQITGLIDYIRNLDTRNLQIPNLITKPIDNIEKQEILDAVYLNWISFVSRSLKDNKRNNTSGVTDKQIKEFLILIDQVNALIRHWFTIKTINQGGTKVIVNDEIIDSEFKGEHYILHLSEDGDLERNDPMLASSFIMVRNYQDIVNTLAKFNL